MSIENTKAILGLDTGLDGGPVALVDAEPDPVRHE